MMFATLYTFDVKKILNSRDLINTEIEGVFKCVYIIIIVMYIFLFSLSF